MTGQWQFPCAVPLKVPAVQIKAFELVQLPEQVVAVQRVAREHCSTSTIPAGCATSGFPDRERLSTALVCGRSLRPRRMMIARGIMRFRDCTIVGLSAAEADLVDTSDEV